MGTLFSEMLAQRMGTGSPLCSPTLIFKIEAAPLVPALGPQLSDFAVVVLGFAFSLTTLLLSRLLPELLSECGSNPSVIYPS